MDSRLTLRWLFLFITVMVAAQFVLPLWWWLQPANVVVETAEPVVLREGQTALTWEAGQTVTIARELCANSAYSGELLRTLWGDGAMPLPHESVDLKVGCHTLYTYVLLPGYLLPAEYMLTSTLQIRLNPIRLVTISLRAIPFVVLASPVTSELESVWAAVRQVLAEHPDMESRIERLQRGLRAIDTKQGRIDAKQERILQYLTQMDAWVKSELKKQDAKK